MEIWTNNECDFLTFPYEKTLDRLNNHFVLSLIIMLRYEKPQHFGQEFFGSFHWFLTDRRQLLKAHYRLAGYLFMAYQLVWAIQNKILFMYF